MNKFILGIALFGLILLNSCASKKIVYVNDMLVDETYPITEAPALRVQKNDRLSIYVSAKSLELAAPFNTVSGAYKVSDDGTISTGIDRSANAQGYLVDKEGNINFPILGTLHLEGLTLDEIRRLISNRLVKEQYINEPIVKVEILNFKISITGAVSGQKVLDVPDGRISILEAITKVGGLSPNADPNKITVIREEDGIRRKIVTNIQSQEIFNSPAYYLKQNDIVYVEPKSAEFTPKEDRFWRMLGIGMGATGIIVSLMTLIKIK